jgi:hypothetical protein
MLSNFPKMTTPCLFSNPVPYVDFCDDLSDDSTFTFGLGSFDDDDDDEHEFIGINVICHPAGDIDIDSDDDCSQASLIEREANLERKGKMCSDLVLPAEQDQDASVMSCTSPMSWEPTSPMSWTPIPTSTLSVPTPIVAVATNPLSVPSRRNGFVRRATYLSLGTALICMPLPTASFFMTLPDGRSVRRSARLNPDNAPDSFELTRLQDGRVVRRSTRIAQRRRRTDGL